MNTSELRQKDAAGLETEVKELQKAHFNMRMQKATQQLIFTPWLRLVQPEWFWRERWLGGSPSSAKCW